MNTRRLLLALTISLLAVSAVFAQFSPRKDYVWARDVLGAAMTLDGALNESVWAQAESVVVKYGDYTGNPQDGYKIMNGTGTVTDGAQAVLKFLADKAANMLYIAVIAKDSSVGGSGWESCDGILAGIYNRNERETNLRITLHKDMFITWIDSGGVGTLPNLTGGNLPSRGIVKAMATVQGISNSDTNGSGQRVADQGWTLEMSASLDSLGYNANSTVTDAVQMSLDVWDADWNGTPSFVGTKIWWGNEWGNNGGGLAARALVRNDVNVNTVSLPAYQYDWVVRNGANYADPVIDGALNEPVWANVPSFDIQYGNDPLRFSYPTIGPDRSGQYVPKGLPFDAGVARLKMFFKGDKLYIGGDIADGSLNHAVTDDFMDALQLNMDIPTDSLRDANVHFMARKRFGIQVDSVSKGGFSIRWADELSQVAGALTGGLQPKAGSTIDNNFDVDDGYTLEMALDLTKLGYAPGASNKVVSIGFNYHDFDMNDVTRDTAAYRTWWFREWPWSATPAFCHLDNATLVSVGDEADGLIAAEFRLYGNYPNPFNPSTTIRFSVPGSGTSVLKVYDILGRLVSESTTSVTSVGMQERRFNASALASGVYYYRVEFMSSDTGARRVSETQKMMFVK